MSTKLNLLGIATLLLFSVLCFAQQLGAQTPLPEVTPNDPGYQDDIARQMNLPRAWAKAQSMEATLPPISAGRPAVLVLDTAMDCTNRDIRDACVSGLNKDFTGENNYLDGVYEHGTAVASKIAGGWNNAFQATPILPSNRLLLIGGKVIRSATNTGTEDAIRAGMDYAVYLKTVQHINVIAINLSAGALGPDDNPAETQKRFETLASNRIIVGLAVRPASSPGSLDGTDLAFVSLVPKYPNTFAVVPLMADGQSLASTYPWGLKTVGFAAPGENINQAIAGTDNPNLTFTGSGSSVSTPETVGAVCFVSIYRQIDPVLALYAVKATSRQTIGTNGKIGYGVPDVYAALTVDFTAPATGLSLAAEPGSPLAVAMDSGSHQGSPIPISNFNNFSTDHRGRAMFVSPNTEVLGSHAVMELKDPAGTAVTVPIEDMRAVPSHPQFAQVTIRIPDNVTAGDYSATLVNGAMRSNTVIVSFQ